MRDRKQTIPPLGTCPQKNRTASDGYAGGHTFMGITENNLTDPNRSKHGLLELILSRSNLNAAYLQVMRNKGAGGVDRMEVESLLGYLSVHKDELVGSIM